MLCWVDTETTGLNPRVDHLLEVALVVTDDDLNEVSHFSTVVQPVGREIDEVLMPDVVREMHTKNGLLAELRAGGGMRRWEAQEALISYLTQPCTACSGDGWVYRQIEGEPPERDGCPNDCHGGAGALAGEVELDRCVNCKKKRAEHSRLLGIDRPDVLACAPGWDGVGGPEFSPKRVPLISRTRLAGSNIGFDRSFLQEHMPNLQKLFDYHNVDVSTITGLAQMWAPEVYEGRPKAEKGAAHRALADVRESINYLRYYRESGFLARAERLAALERAAAVCWQYFNKDWTGAEDDDSCARARFNRAYEELKKVNASALWRRAGEQS